MNEFIDFGKHAIARHLIRYVAFLDDTTTVVELDNGNRMSYKIDKASVMQQLNPPRSNMQYYTHTGNS